MHAGRFPQAHSWILHQYASKYFKIRCGADTVVLKIFHFVFVLFCFFNIRPSPTTRTLHQMRKHTLSLKPSPTKLGSWPSTHAWPMQTNKKGFRVWSLFFCQASTISFYPDICFSLHTLLPHPHPHTPLPPPPIPNPEEAGAGAMGPPGDSKPALTKDKHK